MGKWDFIIGVGWMLWRSNVLSKDSTDIALLSQLGHLVL